MSGSKNVRGWAGIAFFLSSLASAQSAPKASPPSASPADDGLQVPATLAPLTPDVTSVDRRVDSLPPRAPEHFGQRGQWVLMGSSNSLGLSHETYSNSAAEYFNANLALGIDYFVVEHFSVGVDAEGGYTDQKGYGATTLNDTKSTAFSGGVRLGFDVPLGARLSWYPRLTLSIGASHLETQPISVFGGSSIGPSSSQSRVGPAANLYAPLLFEVAPHFVVGLGPRFQRDFAVARGGPYDGSQTSWVGGQLAVGGWWDGAPDAPERASLPAAATPGREKAAESAFGNEGQTVVALAGDSSFSYRTYSRSEGSSSTFNLEPSVDYFTSRGISVGLEGFVGNSSGTSLDALGTSTRFSSTTVGLAPRLGGLLPLTPYASIWFLGQFGYGSVRQSQTSAEGSNEHRRSRTWFELSAPFLLHPSSHFFLGAGPFFFHEVSDKDQNNFENDATEIGLSLVLGGWLAAPAAHSE